MEFNSLIAKYSHLLKEQHNNKKTKGEPKKF